jgi:hypothetical protein
MDRARAFLAASLSIAATAAVAWAGVFNGPGYYVVVSSSYAVAGTSASGYTMAHYYGPIEGPFPDAAACDKQLAARKKQFEQQRKSVLDGYALFMCMHRDSAMTDDSGEWWNPRRDD